MNTKTVVSMFAALLITASAGLAAEKEVTLVGTVQCAKCDLSQTDSCQSVLAVKRGEKDEIYYLTANVASKAFHDGTCSGLPKVKVTGVVKETAGKKEITASKVEEAKG
jgi:hypothetical protein